MPADLTDRQLRAIRLAEHGMPHHLRRRYLELVAEQMLGADWGANRGVSDETVDRAIESARVLVKEMRVAP